VIEFGSLKTGDEIEVVGKFERLRMMHFHWTPCPFKVIGNPEVNSSKRIISELITYKRKDTFCQSKRHRFFL